MAATALSKAGCIVLVLRLMGLLSNEQFSLSLFCALVGAACNIKKLSIMLISCLWAKH